jgi:hypothetical protein
MNECDEIEPKQQVKINSTLAKSVRLRFHPGAPRDFDVVVEDPRLGVFALHSEFDLLVKEEGSEWRPVTLDELRSILIAHRDFLVANRDFLDAGVEPNDRQTLELTPSGEPDQFARKRPKLVRLGTIIGLDACVQRIEAILYRAFIPHLTAGSTFVVPSMLNARECLLRAGFHQDERYEAVLFDPERRIAIRLLERDPRAVLG